MRLFSQLSWYFIAEWRRYLAAVVILALTALLEVLFPQFIGLLVDGVLQHKIPGRQILWWVTLLFFTGLIIYLLHLVWGLLLFGAAYHLAVRLRLDLYHQFSRQPQAFYLRHRTGDLIAHATNDIDRVVFAAGEGVMTLVNALVMGLAVMFAMSYQINWQLTLLSLLPMPVMALLIKCYGDQLHLGFRKSQAAFSRLNDHVQQSLTSIRMIKAFGIEKLQSEEFSAIASDTAKKNMRVARIDALYDPTITIAIAIATLLAIGGGSWLVWHQQLTLGKLTSFLMYLGLMIWPMLSLAWMFNIVERGSVAWERIRVLLAAEPELHDGDKAVPEKSGILQISIDEFSWPASQKPSLRDINVSVQPGQMLGLCGTTGCGKSTLLNLVQRHIDVVQGEIRYHDIPLPQLCIDSWRARLAVVNQTPFLFSDTVANNIALGCPQASRDMIESVARLACIHEDILHLPAGYDTEVGERGVMLSGGQKQRVSIARALLPGSEILILDNALSAVDGRTEYHILQNLRHWGRGRTVIIASHRLSALVAAEEILVLQQGRILQRGDHAHLTEQPGWYQNMYRYQQSEDVVDEDQSTKQA